MHSFKNWLSPDIRTGTATVTVPMKILVSCRKRQPRSKGDKSLHDEKCHSLRGKGHYLVRGLRGALFQTRSSRRSSHWNYAAERSAPPEGHRYLLPSCAVPPPPVHQASLPLRDLLLPLVLCLKVPNHAVVVAGGGGGMEDSRHLKPRASNGS